ncbi:hypothetical protein LZQ00_10905 [Sphingobacterium sp. SRCM116780]|uniref:hypothetical protein n=1 Tax=Sphingobacterium sp. SRCM116780 TaxID=2907623 RepID=UPI001F1B65F5|nr:hypothetical protein [Sphingobacterium sp. SRCM116780]UIR54785.1 hypothetical protein LZQ00_10905 [Sphingobacterium sp. SRCM116780]
METFELKKSIWTEQDYDNMGWHDCNIYGMVFKEVNKETGFSDLAFDIDYIFKWINPIRPKINFLFWISPCTLVFKNTYGLVINIDRRGGLTDMLEVADIILVSKHEEEKNKWVYEWHIELQDGYIKFKSYGYTQYVRKYPILTESIMLSLEERGEISFEPISMQ